MIIQPARSYDAVSVTGDILRGDDGKTAFKMYYVDIVGRDEPARFEWDHSGLSKRERETAMLTWDGFAGIGFVTAFPHITKVFRFGPESEIVCNVKAWNTRTGELINLERGDDYVEFACLAEALIAADEFAFWAAAQTVDEYLERWSSCARAPIAAHAKLRAYWHGNAD